MVTIRIGSPRAFSGEAANGGNATGRRPAAAAAEAAPVEATNVRRENPELAMQPLYHTKPPAVSVFLKQRAVAGDHDLEGLGEDGDLQRKPAEGFAVNFDAGFLGRGGDDGAGAEAVGLGMVVNMAVV